MLGLPRTLVRELRGLFLGKCATQRNSSWILGGIGQSDDPVKFPVYFALTRGGRHSVPRSFLKVAVIRLWLGTVSRAFCLGDQHVSAPRPRVLGHDSNLRIECIVYGQILWLC